MFALIQDGNVFSPPPTPSPTPYSSSDCKSIRDVQGNGSSSNFVGQIVNFCGVFVTSVVYNGFFIQEIVSSTETQTSSSGIFVYDPSSYKDSLTEGNEIDISGRISEYYGLTQLTMDTSIVKVGNNHFFEPVYLNLPVDNMDDYEKYESMVVQIKPTSSNDIVVSEYYNFDRYGEVVVCSVDKSRGRLYQFTENSVPDISGYNDHVSVVERSCITIDDNQSSQNPNPALFGSIYALDSSNYLRGGSNVTVLKGPLWYSFGKWRVATLKEEDLTVVTTNPRQQVPTVFGDIKVTNANLLNYFLTLGSRGADDSIEFGRQASKTVQALSEINPDILGVQELENVSGNGAAMDLVSRMNAILPGRKYTFASIAAGFDTIGTDVIKVDVMFDQNKFSFLGAAQLTDADVDAELLTSSTTGAIFNGASRVPLAVSLKSTSSSGHILTVVANHFKSKGDFGGGASGLDKDSNDGAGNYNHMRLLSSRALLQWLSSEP